MINMEDEDCSFKYYENEGCSLTFVNSAICNGKKNCPVWAIIGLLKIPLRYNHE